MIEHIKDFKLVEGILKENFSGYVNTNDPFEKIQIYKENEQIIGLISYSIIYEREEINYIYFVYAHRKKHIGSRLLSTALEELKKENCKSVSLEVNEKNTSAINLYQKYDFQIKAIRPFYYGKNNGYLLIKEVK